MYSLGVLIMELMSGQEFEEFNSDIIYEKWQPLVR
jgi:hypothetical protein